MKTLKSQKVLSSGMLVWMFVASLVLVSCKKDDDPGPLAITGVSPMEGAAGTVVTITGTGFPSSPMELVVMFRDRMAKVTSVSSTQIVTTVPEGALTGSLDVYFDGRHAFIPTFTVPVLLSVSKLSARYAPPGVYVTLTGTGFNKADSTHNIVKFNNTRAAVVGVNAARTELTVCIPKLATSGPVSIEVDGATVDGGGFTVLAPTAISNVAPLIGGSGTLITLKGVSFSNKAADNIVRFNGVKAQVKAADSLHLVVAVPALAGNGPITYSRDSVALDAGSFAYEYVSRSSTVAGSTEGSDDGNSATAQFNSPFDVELDASGNLYVADFANARIRKITPSGDVSTFAGSTPGNADGKGTAAQFTLPVALAIDAAGNLYVADNVGYIRKISPAGVVTTLAGNGTSAHLDGAGTAAAFDGPNGIAIDASGNLYVSEIGGNYIRKVTPGGTVSTLAGTGIPSHVDGSLSTATFQHPSALAISSDNSLLFVVDGNSSIRIINLTTATVETVADQTEFKHPFGIALDDAGNAFVSDTDNERIRVISPDGTVATIAGTGSAGRKNGDASSSQFDTPAGLAMDRSGNLYVADSGNNLIRKIVVK